MTRRDTLVLGLGLVVWVGCAAEPTTLEREASAGFSKQRIVDGAPHSGDPGVVYLMYLTTQICTGTLIAPKAVLTARHCVEDPASGEPYPVLAVGFGANASDGTKYANVVDIHKTSGPLANNDIAVLLLDEAGIIAPYEWVRDSPPAVGDLVVGVGYGDTGTGSGDAGMKRRGMSRIAEMRTNELITDGTLTCHGDSGGPAFLDDGRVFGVVSRGTLSSCDGQTIYTRTDAFAELIQGAIDASEGDTPDPGGDPGGAGDPSDPGGDTGDSGADHGSDPAPSEPEDAVCLDTCPYSFDGFCDDGGVAADTDWCTRGTDCGDCGARTASSDTEASSCDDSCHYAFDGECDDGGPGADYAICPLGTDCYDCGPR